MGGDHGVEVTIPATIRALKQFEQVNFLLVGDEASIRASLDKHPNIDPARIEIRHASEVITMDEALATALRIKKDSSMRVALNSVKEGHAQACVSAGNTGALMAIARYVLKTLEGIDRPAIVSRIPTKHDTEFRLLDLGANVDSTPKHLFQFAVMGSVLAHALDGIDNPTVGLLNIGKEDIKGNEQVKEASKMLQQCDSINYTGYVEADAMFDNKADVVVCDGFVGNIALKTMEGAAKMFASYAKEAFEHSVITKVGGIVAQPALSRLKERIDPDLRNGASFIGLNGIVVKSHGGTSVNGFFHAIEEAICEVENNITERIRTEIATMLGDAPS